jgi:hypothetical protein
MGAAAALGLSVDAVKRRLRSGALKGRKSPAGTWTVFLEGNAAPAPEPESVSNRHTFPEVERLELRLANARELAEELRARVDAQERQIEALTRHLDAAAEEREQLRQLLAGALSRAPRALVEGSHADVPEVERAPAHAAARDPHARPWWRFWRPQASTHV